MISRTCTAPLDRLKVYLIAQTSNKPAAVEAAKQGSPVKAVRHVGQPLVDAVKELWRAGGIRSLFAGRSILIHFYQRLESPQARLLNALRRRRH